MDGQDHQQQSEISYRKALRYSIFLGWLGVDRFYIGDTSIGVLKLIGLGWYGIAWIADIFVIKRHKHDWDEWIDAKQRRRVEIKQRKEAQKTAYIQQRALEKERAANGHCPKCNSDRLQVAGKTTSKQSIGSGSLLVDLSSHHKYNATHQKIRTTMVRVCLNCGYEF